MFQSVVAAFKETLQNRGFGGFRQLFLLKCLYKIGISEVTLFWVVIGDRALSHLGSGISSASLFFVVALLGPEGPPPYLTLPFLFQFLVCFCFRRFTCIVLLIFVHFVLFWNF